MQPLFMSIKSYSLPLIFLFCRDSSLRQAYALGGSPLTTIQIDSQIFLLLPIAYCLKKNADDCVALELTALLVSGQYQLIRQSID